MDRELDGVKGNKNIRGEKRKKEKQIKILMGHKDPIGCTNHIPIQNLIRMGNNLVCGVILLHLAPAFHSEATHEAK